MSAVPPPSHSTSSAAPPGWARFLDLLSLGLLVLAVVVAEWGGFRERVAGVRIALTSPYRIALLAAVVSIVRHALYRRAPIYRDLPSRLAAAWRSEEAKVVWPVVAGTRFAVLVVGYLAVVMIGIRPGATPERLVPNEIVNLQARWDAQWYFGIAARGYEVWSSNERAQQNYVFFPAYPLLMRVVGRLLGGNSGAFLLAGTLVSLTAFFWGLAYLFRLARELLGDVEQARFTVWLIAAYPFAWFFGAVYTESLFLLGVLGAFYHFRHRQWWVAGTWGLLVGLTRPNGCFLSVVLGLMAIAHYLPTGLIERREAASSPPTPRTTIAALIAAAMPGVGVLLYSAYVWQLTGRPLAWAEGHIAWGREYSGLGPVLVERYAWLKEGLYVYSSQASTDFVNALGALFVLISVYPVARRFGLAYALFILINLLPPMAAGGMLSIGRVSSVLFPAFVWFASAVPERHRAGWLASFMAFQAFGASLFYTWRELY